jgi:PPOX class probable F420-dependent enzyme
MVVELSKVAREILDAPNYAHLATVLRSGAPLVSPVWVLLEDNHILIGTGEGTSKAANTRRDPRVALSILPADNPYRQLQIRGRVIDRRNDDDFSVMDVISRKYTSGPFPWKHLKRRVILVVEPEHERLDELPFIHKPALRAD